MSRFIDTVSHQPRSYIFSSNAEAVVVESILPETNILLISRNQSTGQQNLPILLSASNNHLLFKSNDHVFGDFSIQGDGRTGLNIPGDIFADSIITHSPIHLSDFLSIDIGSNVSRDIFIEFANGGKKWQLQGGSNTGLVWAPLGDSQYHIKGAAKEDLLVIHASNINPHVNIGAPLQVGGISIPRGVLDVLGDTFIDGSLRVSPVGGSNHVVLSSGAVSVSRRMIVLQDNNSSSSHQFVGFGISGGKVVYQSPSPLQPHTFYAATSATASTELLRVGADIYGYPTIGINRSVLESNVALQVGGKTIVYGDLDVRGNLIADINPVGTVLLDPLTNVIPLDVLPTNLVYLGSNHKLDPSIIPISNTINLFRSSANIGIGTRTAYEKLHVVGSGIFTNRLGIGTTSPLARLHVQEGAANIPAVLIDSTGGEGLIITHSNSAVLRTFENGAVGIGTSVQPTGYKLYVNGSTFVSGELITGGINVRGSLSPTELRVGPADAPHFFLQTQEIYGLQTPVYRFQIPLQVHSSFAAQTITGAGNVSDIQFKSVSISVDNGAVLRNISNPTGFALQVEGNTFLRYPPVVISDQQEKANVAMISDAPSRLRKLHGYTYQMPKYDVDRTRVGVLAQEVMSALPEAVETLPDGRLAVSYDSLVALLVQGYCDMYDKIEKLEKLSKVFSFNRLQA